MKIQVKLTISNYVNYGDGCIGIRIVDDNSGIEFFDGEISYENFAKCLTGRGYIPLQAEVRGLKYIGKKRVIEKRSIVCPIKSYDRDAMSKWLEENAKENGWMVDAYLGSQSSIVHQGNKTILNYSVIKYVD